MRENVTESEIAARVVTWLRSYDYDVYQEVVTSWGRCDIVADVHGTLWGIEVKRNKSLALLDQAVRNTASFHRVSIAVPMRKVMGSEAADRFCQQNGIGMIGVETRGSDQSRYNVVEHRRPRFNRRPVLLPRLYEEQKHQGVAGTNNSDYYTPFRGTVDRITSYVRENPGVRLKDAIQHIDHHYASISSAKQSIAHYLKTGVINTLELRDGRVYPCEAKDAH